MFGISLPTFAGGLGGFLSGGIPGAIAGGSSAQQVQDTNKTNLDQAQTNRDFQERMSSTAYQRSMADMGKAGLNPMLAFSQGGASSPGGSTGSVNPVTTQNPGFSGLTNGLDMRATAKQTEQTEAATEKIQSDTDLNEGVANIQAAQVKKINADAQISSAEAVKAKQEADYYDKNKWAIPLRQHSGAAAAVGAGAAALGSRFFLNPVTAGAAAAYPADAGAGSDLREDEKKMLKQYNFTKQRWDDKLNKRTRP